jgi:lipopolysaccharide transport system ATP-binding protein
MTDLAISVRNVSKCYRVFDDQRSRLLHAVWPKHTKGMQEIWALKDINFEIKRGEAVAIIGRNGGGKSTLLEILTGTLTPTMGEVKVNGRVSALLELGSGFNPEYSGRDNVILNGLLLGLSKEDILNRFGEIEAFSEIGDAIDRPVKTYSSGMMMRLAFAVQVLCDPDILIIDEALSVGDFFFQQKCMSYIRGLCAKGVTLLFVSHDMGTVRDLCPRVLYLKQGGLTYDGTGLVGIPLFFKETTAPITDWCSVTVSQPPINSGMPSKQQSKSLVDVKKDAIWSAQEPAVGGKLIAIALYDGSNNPKTSFRLGEKMIVRVAFIPDTRFINHIGIHIFDKHGAIRTATGSLPLKIFADAGQPGVRIFELEIELMIEAGQYGLMVNLGYELERNQGHVLDETGMIGPINVSWDYQKETPPFLGQVGLPVSAKYIV